MNAFAQTPLLRMQATGAVLFVLLLAGCAPYGPPRVGVGASVEESERSMGLPTGEYPLPAAGRRLEFARGPYGEHTWMMDFDATGRLLHSEQVLTIAHFNEIVPGMPASEVLQRIGRPSEVGRIGFQDRALWNYRYEGPFCLWFQLGIDASEHVVDAGYGPDPRCDEGRRDNNP